MTDQAALAATTESESSVSQRRRVTGEHDFPDSCLDDKISLLANQSEADTEEEGHIDSSFRRDTILPKNSIFVRIKEHPVTKFLRSWWRTMVVILPPLLFLPLPILWENEASKALYAILIMAVYWVTEVVPIAVTALLPLILFPALGVLSADDTARNYLKDSNMLFVGGLMMAVAIEKWNLHKRMALFVLMLVGSKPKWLLLGFMCSTAFLSMWISNTATSAMMLPIAQAVLLELKEEDKLPWSPASIDGAVTSVRYTRRTYNALEGTSETHSLDTDSVTIEEKEEGKENQVSVDSSNRATPSSSQKSFNRLAKSLMLGVAYAANIGGTGTLTGTGPNIVLAGLAGDLGINFGLWFAFATPAMLLALFVSWVYLSVLYCDDSFQSLKKLLFKRQTYQFNSKKAKAVIKEQYKKLGRIKYAEVLILVMFVILILLWLFREPRFIPGWGIIFKEEENNIYVSDATAVLAVVFLLFLLPSEPCLCSWKSILKAGSSPRLLDWKSIQHKLPWDVIILLGSGFAIAEATKESGLSEWIGDKLTVFESLHRALIAISVSVMVAGITEFISNVATATLFLPILRTLGTSLCIHPLYLMIPATLSASYAFMFPVATPPNAIAFSYGYIKVYNMVFTGILMNIICVGIASLALNTVGVPIFGLNNFPTDLINGTNCAINSTDFQL